MDKILFVSALFLSVGLNAAGRLERPCSLKAQITLSENLAAKVGELRSALNKEDITTESGKEKFCYKATQLLGRAEALLDIMRDEISDVNAPTPTFAFADGVGHLSDLCSKRKTFSLDEIKALKEEARTLNSKYSEYDRKLKAYLEAIRESEKKSH